MPSLTVLSVRTGRIRDHRRPAWDHAEGPTWRSAYLKEEVAGPVPVGALGLAGDEQHATDVHGGPHMAVLMFASEYYAHWRALPGLERMGPGAFAENLTVAGLLEDDVCIGDVFADDQVALEVSQPRGPCQSIARFWDRPELLQRVLEHGHAGWYLRVQREGTIARGARLERVAHPNPDWSVARVFQLRNDPRADRDAMRAAAALPQLGARMRTRLLERAESRA